MRACLSYDRPGSGLSQLVCSCERHPALQWALARCVADQQPVSLLIQHLTDVTLDQVGSGATCAIRPFVEIQSCVGHGPGLRLLIVIESATGDDPAKRVERFLYHREEQWDVLVVAIVVDTGLV